MVEISSQVIGTEINSSFATHFTATLVDASHPSAAVTAATRTIHPLCIKPQSNSDRRSFSSEFVPTNRMASLMLVSKLSSFDRMELAKLSEVQVPLHSFSRLTCRAFVDKNWFLDASRSVTLVRKSVHKKMHCGAALVQVARNNSSRCATTSLVAQ